MVEIFLEAIIAPGFDPEALEILKTKKDLRILQTPPLRALFPGEGSISEKWWAGSWFRTEILEGSDRPVESRDQKKTNRGGEEGPWPLVEGGQTCEVECHRPCPGRPDHRDRGRPDEPCRFHTIGSDEGPIFNKGNGVSF